MTNDLFHDGQEVWTLSSKGFKALSRQWESYMALTGDIYFATEMQADLFVDWLKKDALESAERKRLAIEAIRRGEL